MTGNHPKAMWPGVKSWFGVGYGEHPEAYKDLFEMDTSKQAWEEDVQMKGFGLMPVKNQGSPTTYVGQNQGYTSRYTHVAYSMGYIVTYEELLNNLYEKVSKSRAKALGFSKRQTRENIGALVYIRATSSSYTGGDGVALASASHPSAAGNQSNLLSPASDVCEEALEDMIVQIMGATDDAGLKIGLMPMSLHAPRQIWFECNRILKSTLQSETANNAINVLKSTNALPGGIKMNPYFTDTDAFGIRTNCPDGMKWYQRHSYDLKQDNDFDTDNAKAKTYDYFSCGWTDWRGYYHSAGV